MEGLLSTGPNPSSFSFLYKMVKLVIGGSVINGATLSSLLQGELFNPKNTTLALAKISFKY